MEASETTALARIDPPKSHGALVLRDALKEASEQRSLLREYVAKHMVEGTDYGKIPGTDKPTLLKPGAEKLTDLFRCTPKFALISKEEEFERGFFNYMFRVRLYSRDADAVLAEGFGSANSREGRYRWRNANRKCPLCNKESIIQGKAEYGGGWLCFKKKGGCGAKFDAMAQEITGQAQGQVENDDIATLANTILKMAKKRALVDGAIALARCSDLFTQDVEDLADHAPDDRGGPTHPAEPPTKAPVQAKPPQPPQQRQEMSEGARIAAEGQAPKLDAELAKFHSANAETCAKDGHVWNLKGTCDGCGAKEAKPTPGQKQSATLRAKISRLWETAKKAGVTVPEFQGWAASILGKAVQSAEWTQGDVMALENAKPPERERQPGED